MKTNAVHTFSGADIEICHELEDLYPQMIAPSLGAVAQLLWNKQQARLRASRVGAGE